jgi:hypothetical protein
VHVDPHYVVLRDGGIIAGDDSQMSMYGAHPIIQAERITKKALGSSRARRRAGPQRQGLPIYRGSKSTAIGLSERPEARGAAHVSRNRHDH